MAFLRRGSQIRDDDIQGTGDRGSNQWAATENSLRKQRQRAGTVTSKCVPGTFQAPFGSAQPFFHPALGGLGEKMAGGGCRPDSVPRRAASIHLGRASPHGSSSQPGDLSHSRWDTGTGNPRPPYSALLRMGFTVPPPFPEGRCALTAPFHPYPRLIGGGLLSAALSLALPRPGVTRHAACRGVRTFL